MGTLEEGGTAAPGPAGGQKLSSTIQMSGCAYLHQHTPFCCIYLYVSGGIVNYLRYFVFLFSILFFQQRWVRLKDGDWLKVTEKTFPAKQRSKSGPSRSDTFITNLRCCICKHQEVFPPREVSSARLFQFANGYHF